LFDPLQQRIQLAVASGQPLLLVLAGSNGAGKSTFHAQALRHVGLPFINADEMAKALAESSGKTAAEHAYDAMNLAEMIRTDMVAQKASFCMETVLSDTLGAKLAFFADARSQGYFLLFIHIRISDVKVSIARVTHRVQNGGHDVPDDKLLTRFGRTRDNAAKALAIADAGFVFDNSNPASPYQLVEIWQDGSRQE
jgi:predicted ABC-type ATPase